MVSNDTMLLKMKVSLCCLYACNAYTNAAGMCITDVTTGGGSRMGNLTVVEGCVFLENEAPRHGSAVAIGTYLYILWTSWNHSF